MSQWCLEPVKSIRSMIPRREIEKADIRYNGCPRSGLGFKPRLEEVVSGIRDLVVGGRIVKEAHRILKP